MNVVYKFIRKYTDRLCTIPRVFRDRIEHDSASQIVFAWHTIQTMSSHTYVSIESCRTYIDDTCSWDLIGNNLQLLLNKGTVPCDLVHMNTIGHSNCTILMGNYGIKHMIAVKQHVFYRGSWEVPDHTFREMSTLHKLNEFDWVPTVQFQSVSQDMVEIGMEYIPISMSRMLSFGTKRNMNFGRNIQIQLLKAVEELHLNGYAHCDIKPDNIRFRSDGGLVLIDYDSCTRLHEHMNRTKSICTSFYRDPYLFDDTTDMSTYDYRTLDAFSCGAVFMYIVLGGKHIFDGTDDDSVFRSMKKFQRESNTKFQRMKKIPSRDKVVLMGLMNFHPVYRMKIKRALNELKNTVL